jgi:hypothetical protein
MAPVRPRRRFAAAVIPTAAALLVAATLTTAWLLNPSAPAPSSYTAPPLEVSMGAAASLSAAEDSTASLLQAYDPLSAKVMDVEPEEIQEVLSPTEPGGWNG